MAAPENTQQSRNWLVRSSTKILGPFSKEEVMTMLARRQISIIDEIRQPEGRWNYIRENRFFKEIVKDLRYEQDQSQDNTMTSTATAATMTITKTDSVDITDEFTPTPVIPPLKSKVGTNANNSLKDVTPLFETPQRPSQAPPATSLPKSFGNIQDQRVQQKLQTQNMWIRGALIAVIAVACLFVGNRLLNKDKRSDMNYDQLLASALRYKELGLYEKSLENYKRASAIREPDLESQFAMVFLLIGQDRQSLNGRRIIERALLKEGRSREEIIQGNLAMALSYMMEGDLKQAEEFLQKTLGFDANNEAAKINLATIQLKKGNYAQAVASFDQLTKSNTPAYPLVLLYKTVALVELSKTQLNRESVQNDINDIRAYLARSHFLKKELTLLLVYLHQLLSDTPGVLDAISIFVDEPFKYSAMYVRDLSLDWRNADWDYLDRYCSDLYGAASGVAGIKAVRGVCLIQTNRDMEAAKLLEEALTESPYQVQNLQAQAQYLWKLGRLSEAQLLMQKPDYKITKLAYYIQGENCWQLGDLNCSESSYKILIEKDFGDVVAQEALGRIALRKKQTADARAAVKAGFEAEANFIPLIELRDKLESP